MTAAVPAFVLDTTVLSRLMAPFPIPAVVAWIERTPPVTLFVPTGAVFELQVGVALARQRGNTRAGDLERRLDLILSDRRFRTLVETPRAARIRAAMATEPTLRNLAMPDPRSRRVAVGETLAIAAAAVAEGAAVATLNRRDFAAVARMFALPGIFDPGTGSWVGGNEASPSCPDGLPGIAYGRSFPRRRLADGRGSAPPRDDPPAGGVRARSRTAAASASGDAPSADAAEHGPETRSFRRILRPFEF